MASTTTTTTASRRSTTTPGTQSIHIANEQQKQQKQQQQQHRINSRMNAGLSIPRSRHHHYRYRRTTLTFVDVLIQRYGVDDVVGQFDDCPFEVFVLGGISPRKSGKNNEILYGKVKIHLNLLTYTILFLYLSQGFIYFFCLEFNE